MTNTFEKIKKINSLVQNPYKNIYLCTQISKTLNDIIKSNILLINKKGKVLTSISDADISYSIKSGSIINLYLVEQLNSVFETRKNSDILSISNFLSSDYNNLIVPIICSGNKEGTLISYRLNNEYSLEDIIILEYAATIIGLEIYYYENQESEQKHRKTSIVKSAISTLSYSELEAVILVFDNLDDKEGLIVASRIADKVGITRSVIVNALRKLESAGIIESRSLGMKGTYIKVLNDMFLEELKKLKK